MPVSRSDRRRRAGRWLSLAAGAALLSAPTLAAAQQLVQQLGPPIPLVPQSVAPPRTGAPVGPEPGPPKSLLPSEPAGPATPGWAGETAPEGEPLPRDFWRGTPRALAAFLLARLPDTTSPALQAVERRLLLSPGAAPAGPDPGSPETALPVLRAAALLRLGEVEPARAVIAAMSERDRAAAAPLQVEADLLAGDLSQACDRVADAIRRDQAMVWQRALVACQALQGEGEKADLGLQLLSEEKAGRDEALGVAVDALAGRPAPAVIERLDAPEPLLLRALDAAGRRLAPPLVARLRGDLAAVVALDDKAPAETRVLAAERATATGALPVDRLRRLYGSVAEEEANGAASAALDRARRFAAILAAPDPVERLGRIVAFTENFPDREAGGFLLAARVVAAPLHEIGPDPTVAGAAAPAARLALAAGDYEAARHWIEIDPAGAPELGTVLALATGQPATSQPAAGPSGTGGARGPMLLAVRSALGDPIAPAEWTRLPAAAWAVPGLPAAPPAAWLDLSDAAGAKRVGEAALAAVLVAAPQGGLAKDPVALHSAVEGLRRIGLTSEARRLAAEAALAP